MIHVAIGLVEITLLVRAMNADIAIHWATNIVSPHTEGGDNPAAIVAVHLMKTVTMDGKKELVNLRIAAGTNLML